MATVHRYSFTKLSGPEQTDDHFIFNIVFIHGLRGHPRGTWEAGAAGARNTSSSATKKPNGFRSLFKRRTIPSRATDIEQVQDASSVPLSLSLPSSKVFWPEEYLASDMPQACVWTYGYDADVIGGLFQANNKNSISQHGRDLSVRLEREIKNRKPLVFVVHSLGGIILKDAVRRSEVIREQTKLIIFLGTPHRGSAYAGWGQIASNLARLALQDSNKKILETLEVNNEVLDNIHEEFKTIVFKGGMAVFSFQETRGISGMKGLSQKVVDDFSSKLDLPQALETVESIDANHMQMARYSSKDDQGYRAISGILKAFVRQVLESQRLPPTTVADVVDIPSSDPPFMIPFARDAWFTGREDNISEISNHRATSERHSRVALVGLGGVGKSQIAIEYAYRIQQTEPHTSVLWIHASNATRFQQGYRDIANKILLPGRDEPKTDILLLVYAWLSDRRNGRWLMILDNVDDDSVFFADDEHTAGPTQMTDATDYTRPLESFLPQTANGTILITSRNKAAAINLVGGHGSIVQIQPMEESDALVLLHTRVPFGESDQAEAKALVHALEWIPLAITHAAAYIKTRSATTTIYSYLQLFCESSANQVHLLGNKSWKDIRRDHSIRHAVITTWQISFNQIRKTNQLAACLLALMSMFDKHEIPRWVLQADISQLVFDDALAPLLSFSLVRTEIKEQALSMHRLVQLSMRTWLEAEGELGRWVKESILTLNAGFPNVDYRTWAECSMLLPHVKEIISHATQDEEDLKGQTECAYKAGWYLLSKGEFTAAEGFARVFLEPRENMPTRNTLYSVGLLGILLQAQGKFEEAEAMQRRALKLEKVYGLQYIDQLTCMANLATLLQIQGRYEEAEAMYRQALEEFEKGLGSEHFAVLGCMGNFGSFLQSQGKYEEAEARLRQALEGLWKTIGLGHPNALVCMSTLGSVFQSQGKYEKAEQVLVWVVKASKRALGDDHPDTLRSMHLLAVTLNARNRSEEALLLIRACFEGRKRVLGAHHPETESSLNILDEWHMGVDTDCSYTESHH